ncbi:MAG: GNAT family N-acetyltransferase [Pseudomonadota bacterium]
MTYVIQLERGDHNYQELEPMYRQHYSEMQARLAADGIRIPEFNPRLDEYFRAFSGGWLLNYVVRQGEKAVGYANVYITNDMHNSEKIAQEDLLYVLPEHRNGIGRKLVKHILTDLKERGVKRVFIQPVTDLRVAKIWRRMGFRDVSETMVYDMES